MEQLRSGPQDGSETPGLDHEIVAARAYELWMRRGCPIGSPEEDWYQAKTELALEAADPKKLAAQAKAA